MWAWLEWSRLSLTLIGAKLPTDVRRFLAVQRKQYLAANLPRNIIDAIYAIKSQIISQVSDNHPLT